MNNKQKIKRKFEEIVTKAGEDILDFNHVRLQQGGLEIDLFVISRLASPNGSTEVSERGASPDNGPWSSYLKDVEVNVSDSKVSEQAAKYRETILEGIQQIFRYKRFHKDDVMAKSSLHDLIAVQQACQAWMRERGIVSGSLSQQDKATVLRKFLANCLDQTLCPTPGTAPPENLSSSELRNEWLEYLILRWQYVDGQSREDVITEVSQNHCFMTGGSTYTRRLKAARGRLAAIICQKEMHARPALS